MMKHDDPLLNLAREASQSCVCQMTRKTARLVTKAYDDALRPLGLRGTQFTMLAAATAADGGVSLTELASLLGMDRTTLSRNLRPLERDGLIVFSDHEITGRSRSVRPTDKGRELFTKAEPLWRHVQSQVSGAFSAQEYDAFAGGMRTLARTLS